jgi:hypothetical protein
MLMVNQNLKLLMNKKERIEQIRLKQLEIRKKMFQEYVPSQVFVSLMKDIDWYNKYIRYIEENNI